METTTEQKTFTMADYTAQYAEEARELKEKASKLDSWCKKLNQLLMGELLVIEYVNSQIPLRMGVYDGVGNKDGEPSIHLKNPAYVFVENEKVRRFSFNRGEDVRFGFFTMVADTIHGAQPFDIYRESEADAALKKYGLSLEKVRKDLMSQP